MLVLCSTDAASCIVCSDTEQQATKRHWQLEVSDHMPESLCYSHAAARACSVDETLKPSSSKNMGSWKDTPEGSRELTSKLGSFRLPFRMACVISTGYSWVNSWASSSQSCV